MRKAAIVAAFAASALLAGCGNEQEAGGVTAEEAQQLNEAAEMLDASPDSLVAPDETGLGNGEAGSEEADAAAVAAAGNEAGNGAANSQ